MDSLAKLECSLFFSEKESGSVDVTPQVPLCKSGTMMHTFFLVEMDNETFLMLIEENITNSGY